MTSVNCSFWFRWVNEMNTLCHWALSCLSCLCVMFTTCDLEFAFKSEFLSLSLNEFSYLIAKRNKNLSPTLARVLSTLDISQVTNSISSLYEWLWVRVLTIVRRLRLKFRLPTISADECVWSVGNESKNRISLSRADSIFGRSSSCGTSISMRTFQVVDT